MLMRVIGALFVAVGFVVAIHTVVEPLYHVSGPDSPYSALWSYINPLMALAVIAGVVLGCRRKMAVDAEGDDAPVTRAYVAANALLYGFLFVGILFFFNWFNYMTPSYTAVGPRRDGGDLGARRRRTVAAMSRHGLGTVARGIHLAEGASDCEGRRQAVREELPTRPQGAHQRPRAA